MFIDAQEVSYSYLTFEMKNYYTFIKFIVYPAQHYVPYLDNLSRQLQGDRVKDTVKESFNGNFFASQRDTFDGSPGKVPEHLQFIAIKMGKSPRQTDCHGYRVMLIDGRKKFIYGSGKLFIFNLQTCVLQKFVK